jgi:hypothetical protein
LKMKMGMLSEMNIEQLLHADTVVLVEDSYETLARRTA